MLNEALSFGMTVTPGSSGLIIMTKVMINEANSVACIVGALHWRWLVAVGGSRWPVDWQEITLPHSCT